jgi:hypothetical protein
MCGRVDLPKLRDVRGGFNMQTKSTSFSCDPFDQLRDQSVQGSYTCKSGQKDPGRFNGKDGGSDGNKTGNAASSNFYLSAPVYSFFGFVAFLLML